MIAKCMKILEHVAGTHGKNSLSSISSETEIPRSTVHRLMKTMERCGMIVQQRQGGYVVSPQLLRVCIQGTSNQNALSVLIPLADDLRDVTHETVSVNVITGMERMCIYRAEGDYPITRMVMIGSRAPLFFGAAGRVLAAGLRPNKLKKAIEYALQNGYAQEADVPRLMEQVKQDQKNGYAISIEERHVGCGSIAVPVKRELTGETVAALSISALAIRIEEKNTQNAYLAYLQQAAAEGNAKILI